MTYLYYPPLILIYLTYYPFEKHLTKQIGYILLWTLVWAVVEGFYVLVGLNTHHNGWNIWWTYIHLVLYVWWDTPSFYETVVNMGLCFLLTVFIIIYFGIPIIELK